MSEGLPVSIARASARGLAATLTGAVLGYMLLQLTLYIDFSFAYCPTPDPPSPGGSASPFALLIVLLLPLGAMTAFLLRKRLNLRTWLAMGLTGVVVSRLLFQRSEQILNGICTNALGG